MFFSLLGILNRTEKIKFFAITILIIISMVFELVGITSIFPFVKVLVSEKEESLNTFKIVLNYFKFSSKEELVLFFSTIIFIIFFLKSSYFYLLSRIQFSFAMNFQNRITNGVFRYYLNLKYKNFIKIKTSKIIQNITIETYNFIHGFFLCSLTIISEIIISCGILIFLLILNFKVFLLCLCLSLITFFIYLYATKKKLKYFGELRNNLENKRIKTVQNTFSMLKELIIYDKKNFFKDRFSLENKKFCDASKQILILEFLPKHFVELFFILIVVSSIAGIILFGGSFNTVDLSMLSIFFLGGSRIVISLARLLNTIQRIKFYSPSVKGITSILNKNINDDVNQLGNKNYYPSKFESLEFINFNFKYEDNYIFRNANFKIYKNEIIAITGKNGSGKSTLVDLLLGMQKVDGGQIKLNNTKIKNKEKFEIMQYCGLLPQNITIFDDSIASNISINNGNKKKDKKILDHLKINNLTKFIEEISNEKSYNLGEQGNKLSGGQRQRISIARLLYHDPQIFIFDEPTSAIDTIGTEEFKKLIKFLQFKKTIIIISHDKSLLKLCNKILYLNNGKIESKDGTARCN